MLDLIRMVDSWLADHQQIALATVTKTWGSAPRREGAKMAVTPDLTMIGSVSGGCVEGAVIEEALDSLKNGKPRLLSFGIADDTAWEVGLTCGGSIHVFVEPLDRAWWMCVKDRTQNDLYSAAITILDGDLAGEKLVIAKQGEVLYQTSGLTPEHIAEFKEIALNTSRSGEAAWQDTQIMVDVLKPRPHLIIIGGVHVAIPLQAMAHTLGFRVSLVDPRSTFASPERFPEIESISHDYPNKAFEQLGLDDETYLAVLTHDPKIDDQALLTALPAGIPYVGVLSSRKTHAQRVARLKEAGLSDDLIKQIYTPIGLDIGTNTPEEIALGIMSEIVAVRNGVRKSLTI